MPTNKQRKLAKLIVENSTLDKPMNRADMLVSVGYSENTAIGKPKEIFDGEGVHEALAEFGFTETNAKSVVAEILLNPDEDANVRLNAAKEVFKVRGSYAAEKTMALNVDLTPRNMDSQELEDVRREFEDKLKAKLIGA